MINLAFEIPFRYLKRFSKSTDFDFVLTHLVKSSTVYRDFYREQSEKGRYVILDNSVFELGKPISPDELLFAAGEIKATTVIIPDFLKDSKKTLESVNVVIGDKRFDKYQLAAVPQGDSFDDWISCYKVVSLMERVSTICIPFDIHFKVPGCIERNTLTRSWMERRIGLLKQIKDLGLIVQGKKYHLLGASDCVEFRFAKKLGFVTSADTSSPVVHGMFGVLYRDYGLPGEKIKEKINFEAVLTKKQIKDIFKNISKVRKFAV